MGVACFAVSKEAKIAISGVEVTRELGMTHLIAITHVVDAI